MNTGIGLNANNHSPLTNAPPQSLTPVQHMQHRHQHSTNSISSTNSQLLQSDQSQLQQSPQAFLNQPTVNRTSSRIPSGYSSNQMQLNATNPLLRNVGISPPSTQIQPNSAQQRLPSSFYSQSSHSSTQLYDQYSNQHQQLHQPQPQQNQQSNQKLHAQNTNGSMHSNFSIHSYHDDQSSTGMNYNNNGGNNNNNFSLGLEEGLTRSLSGLDLQSNGSNANKKPFW